MTYLTDTSNQIEHKKYDINSQNDQCFLIKWNILNAYYIPTSHLQFYNLPTYLPRCTTYLPTHPPTYLSGYLPIHLPTHPPTYLHINYVSTHSPT
jgi:hypothetical protein